MLDHHCISHLESAIEGHRYQVLRLPLTKKETTRIVSGAKYKVPQKGQALTLESWRILSN